jgi:hypothetical protein
MRARLKAIAKHDIEMQVLSPVPAQQPEQPITMQDTTAPSVDTTAKPKAKTGFNFGRLNKPLPAIREERYVLGGAPAAGGRFLPFPASAHTVRSPVTDARIWESSLNREEREKRGRAYSEASAKLEGTWDGYDEQEEGGFDYSKLKFDQMGK